MSRAVWLSLLLLVPCTTRGQDAAALPVADPGLRDVSAARALGMGGAYRALGQGIEAVTGNPAAMSLYPRYLAGLSGAWDVNSKFAYGNVAILDSATNVLAAGVGYHLISLGRGEQRRIGHLNTLAMSVPLSDNFLIGASARHVLMTGARQSNAITLDAGLVLRLFRGLTAGFSGHNLIDVANPELSRFYALCAGWSGGGLSVAGDLRADFLETGTALVGNVGAEYVLADLLPVRAGYSVDRINDRQDLSFGLGIALEGNSVDLAWRHQLQGGAGELLMLTLKLQTAQSR